MMTKVSDATILNRKYSSIKGQITRISNVLKDTVPNEETLEIVFNSLRNMKQKMEELRTEFFFSITEKNLLEEFENLSCRWKK